MRLLSALLLIAATAFAQSTGEKLCTVDGSVVNSVTGATIPRAYVKVTTGEDSVVAESDAAGKWGVEHLACVPATIDASRIGFLQKPENPQKPRQPLVLSSDNPVHDVRLELVPQAIIAGKVLEDRGEPLQGANVTLLTSRVSNGLRGLQPAQSTNTNDLGEYRFTGLAAGRYLICAAGGDADKALAYGAKAFGEKCYPGPPDAGSAIAMNVAAGYEGRVDFTLTALSGVQVKGVISGMPKNAEVYVNIDMDPWGMHGTGMTLSAPVRRDGSFIFRNVPPGSHLLTAGFSDALQPSRLRIDVGASDLELQVSLDAPANVTGTVRRISTAGEKNEKPQYTVQLMSDEGYGLSTGGDDWDESGTSFKLGVIPGRYRLEFFGPPLYMKSVTWDDRDIAGSIVTIGPGGGKIDIVAADDNGSLEGDVSQDDQPATAWILLQKDGMPSRNVRADAKGHFKIDNVPPGAYKAYAWDDSTNVEYANPDWMRRNAKGVAVTVQPGQTSHVKIARQAAPSE